MPKCSVDISTSPTLRRDIKKLARKYKHIRSDLESLKALIEADYTKNAHATNLKFFGQPGTADLHGKAWKYDCKSSDINKHQRESLRLVAVFLEKPGGILYAIRCFIRADNDCVYPDEVRNDVRRLKEELDNPSEPECEEREI